MISFKTLGAALCAGLLALGAGSASADTKTFTVNQVGSTIFGSPDYHKAVTVNYYGGNKSVAAGPFRLKATGPDIVGGTDNFVAFCIDLADTIQLNKQFETPYNPGFSTTQLARLDRILNNASISNADQGAGAQIAIWEIVTDTTLALDAGNFKFTTSGAVLTAANSFLTLADNGSVALKNNLQFLKASVQPNQELVTVDLSTVPLPASAWLLVAAMGGLGALRRKRAA